MDDLISFVSELAPPADYYMGGATPGVGAYRITIHATNSSGAQPVANDQDNLKTLINDNVMLQMIPMPTNPFSFKISLGPTDHFGVRTIRAATKGVIYNVWVVIQRLGRGEL